MAIQYKRREILTRLRDQVKQNSALLMFGAGTGLTAKCADLGGADLVAVYSTAKFRMMGLPTLLVNLITHNRMTKSRSCTYLCL
jgi:predicted TIM-barrel enzyme